MDDHEIIDDLRRAGAEPVPDEIEAAHLSRIAATVPAAGSRRIGRLAVAGAAIVGFLAGSTGFAMAGALPDPAQGAAHDVLSVVQVEVPDRDERRGNGPPAHVLEDPCKGPPTWALERRAPTEEEVAAHEALRNGPECADDRDDDGRRRPAGAGPPEGTGPPDGAGPDEHADDLCRGRPPWAGQPDMAAEEKQRSKDERRAACGQEAEDEGG